MFNFNNIYRPAGPQDDQNPTNIPWRIPGQSDPRLMQASYQPDQIQPINMSDLMGSAPIAQPQIPVPMQGAQQQQSPEEQHITDVLGQFTQNKQNQQTGNNFLTQILANRMQPESVDTTRSLLNSAVTNTYSSPELEMAQRYKAELSPYTDIIKAQSELGNARSSMAGGATGVLMNRIMAENPGMSTTQALQMVQTGLRQNMVMGPDGALHVMSGAPEALSAISNAKQTGTNQSNLTFAQPIAQAKAQGEVSGKGEITDIQKRQTGQQNVESTAATLEDLYNQLEAKKAVVSTKNTPMENLSASTRSGMVGQFFGKKLGTEEQSIRNQIAMQIPNLINDIRSATGMSAKTMDSNAELQFYLKMATDPSADIEANRAALATIRQKYLGTGGAQPTIPSGASNIPQDAINHLRQNPSLAPAFEQKYGVSAKGYLQ